MWILIIGFSIVQYKREVSYKSQHLLNNVDILNKRMVDLLDKGDSPEHYLNFVNDYYDPTIISNISLTVYDMRNDRELYRIGFEAPLPKGISDNGSISGKRILESAKYPVTPISPDSKYYYATDISQDSIYKVQTLLPYDSQVLSEVSDPTWWWIAVLILCTVVTIFTYLITRHLTNNVKLMRVFARNAANDKDFNAADEFSNDELGEIALQIISIYNARKVALASRELEHKIALKATEDRNRMRTQLTNNINHELKTPATIIKGYLDTIIDNPDMDDDSRNHFITKARAQAERLCAILNDISTMTRLDDASKNVQLEEIDFTRFVEDLAVDVEESGLVGELVFNYDIPEHCMVKGNLTVLNASMMNLVKNAAAYSKGSEMGIKLVAENNRFYTFSFWDNGQGVAEEHIPMLFERFYRVDKGRSRKAGGTGLGLSIVRSSINTIGGTISVRNRAGGGLEFIFTLARWSNEKNKDNADKADETSEAADNPVHELEA